MTAVTHPRVSAADLGATLMEGSSHGGGMRRLTAVLLVACLAATAGCTGMSLSADRIEFDAGQTVVEEAAVADAGYELQESTTEEVNETITPAGREMEVVVRTHVAGYEKSVGPGDAAVSTVGVVTMPDASVAGRNLNPVAGMNETELLERFAGEADGSLEFEEQGHYTVRTLGGEANVTVYRATSSDPEQPDAYVHLLRDSPAASEDVVLAYGMYPVQVDGEERDDVERMLSSLEYTPPE